MKETENKKEGYIDNDYLRDLIITYNDMNYEDDGSWCQQYLKKLEGKYNSGKTKQQEYDEKKAFILKKINHIHELRDNYFTKWSQTERNHYDFKFNKVKRDLCDAFIKIIDGRIISFKLVASKSEDDIADIRQNALLLLFKYINRYNGDLKSSAFAYVTQQITNTILLNLKAMKFHSDREIAGLDFYNNMNTLDDPHDGESNLKEYFE